jgi:hypothetical protein
MTKMSPENDKYNLLPLPMKLKKWNTFHVIKPYLCDFSKSKIQSLQTI